MDLALARAQRSRLVRKKTTLNAVILVIFLLQASGANPARGIEGRVEARSRRGRTAIYRRTGERHRHHDGRSPARF